MGAQLYLRSNLLTATSTSFQEVRPAIATSSFRIADPEWTEFITRYFTALCLSTSKKWNMAGLKATLGIFAILPIIPSG